MAFRDGASDEWAWTGALMIADTMDDLRIMRAVCEGMGGVKSMHRKKD
jgi:hypothetical protein